MSRTVVSDLVRNSATTALQGTYVQPDAPEVQKAVAQVSTDVDTALDSALEMLRQEARALGASNAQVDAIFAKAGLSHDPEPVAIESGIEDEPKGKKGKKFAALQAQVDALTERFEKAVEFARSNGFRG